MRLHSVTISTNQLETETSFCKKTHPLPQSQKAVAEQTPLRHQAGFSKGNNDLL